LKEDHLRILFVNPFWSARHPPLGLAYLSSFLQAYYEGEGLECHLYDEVAGDSDFSKVLDDFRPDIIAVTSVTSTFPRACELAAIVKAQRGAPCVVGGPHVTALPESIVGTAFDAGVCGEGEQTFLELVTAASRGHAIRDLKISGIVINTGQGLYVGPRRPLVPHLDKIPSPDRTLLRMERYVRSGTIAHGLMAKGTSVVPSRGCTWGGCDFCSSRLIWGNKVRFFSPSRVAEEVHDLVLKYGLNFVLFLDDNFTADEIWLSTLAAEFRQRRLIPPWFHFDCESLATSLTARKAELLASMGCVRIEFGFESGHPRILRRLKRGQTSVSDNEKAIRLCRAHGLRCYGNAIFGYFDETEDEFDTSVRWFNEMPLDYRAPHLYTPFPGTSGWREAVRRGLVDAKTARWETFMAPWEEDCLVVNQCRPRIELIKDLQAVRDQWNQSNRMLLIARSLSQMDRRALHSVLSQRQNRENFIEILGDARSLGLSCCVLIRNLINKLRRTVRQRRLDFLERVWSRVHPFMALPRWGPRMGFFWCYGDVLGRRLWCRQPVDTYQRAFLWDYLQPGMVVVDVGAHQGLYTILAARRCGSTGIVVAIEPAREQKKRLARNVWWNMCRNVRIHGEAVGAEVQAACPLYVVKGFETGGNSLRPIASDVASTWSVHSVFMVTLDKLCSDEHLENIDVLKVDVEGGERDVFAGAKELLSRKPRPLVLWEVSDRRTQAWGYKARETVITLLNLGFISLEIGDHVLLRHRLQDEYPSCDLLAVPQERWESFVKRMNSLGWRVIGPPDR